MITIRTSAIGLAAGLVFATGAFAANMSKSDYKDAKNTIGATYKTAKAGCDAMSGNAKDICQIEAKGNESMALADLEANYKPSTETRYKARMAKGQAAYDLSKERCDDSTGNAKDVCVKEAKAALVSAKADAKQQRTTSDANHDAAEESADAKAEASDKAKAAGRKASEDKLDAQYQVAKEKCDAAAGTAKDTCLDEAKLRFKKS